MKPKRYLSGIDWAINGLDYISRRKSGVGNISQIVLEIDGHLKADDFRNSLRTLLDKFPILFGGPARDYNLAPYWKYRAKTGRDFILNLESLSAEGEITEPRILSFLAEGLNQPFSSPSEHLAFRLVIGKNKTFLGFTFDHCLFDAYGAEAFLNMLQQDWVSCGRRFKDLEFSESAHLNHWKEKFLSGQKINRQFLKLNSGRRIINLPVPKNIYKNKFRFKVLSFNQQESRRIIDSAYNKCGYLMISPFILANSLKAAQPLFVHSHNKCKDYLVAVSTDMRSDPVKIQDVFFNHLSFLFFRIKYEALTDSTQAFDLIKSQMYEQVKSDTPRALCQASLLMRIAPLSALDFFTSLLLRNQGATLGFSYIGKTKFEFNDFLGGKVLNLFHMPRVPIPPGLGIFFNSFQDRLNAVISYLEGLISERQAQELEHRLKNILLS